MKNRQLKRELTLINAIAKLKTSKKPLTAPQQEQLEFFTERLSECLHSYNIGRDYAS